MPSDIISSRRRDARNFAIAGAGIVAVGLLGQAAIATSSVQRDLPPKSVARVAFVQRPVRAIEPFAPRADVADAAPNALKSGIQWSMPQTGVALAILHPQRVAAEPNSMPRPKLVAVAPLPPRRPADLVARVQPAPEGPPVFVAAVEPRAKIGSVELPRFVPTSASLLRRIGDVGSSIGRMMRISSR